jgi:hypothetical protein
MNNGWTNTIPNIYEEVIIMIDRFLSGPAPADEEEVGTKDIGRELILIGRRCVMKKLVAVTVIVVLVCVVTAGAAPAGMISPAGAALQDTTGGHGLLADGHDVVMTHETIQEQREDIRQDVRDTSQDITGNLTAGHEAIQDQREAMRNDQENWTTGHEAIVQERQGEVTYVHENRVELAQNVTDLQSQIQSERQTEQEEFANLTDAQKLGLVHWYDVGIATHALMSMQNLTGVIGPQVADLAYEINASENNITPLEQRIEDRSEIFRLLLGGDQTASNQINEQVALNQQRIQTIQQLMQNSTLQPDVQQAMQDQITTLQQEQARLANLTAAEQNDRGLFWWI